MISQTTSSFLMVRPMAFSYNTETAATNIFQNRKVNFQESPASTAILEFDHMLHRMEKIGLHITVFDQLDDSTPDAVFPNNWISMHSDGSLVLYPMLTNNRRKERRADIVERLQNQYVINQVIDLTHFEQENKFLEGTGSIVFDHINKRAYACLSERTNQEVLLHLCKILQYTPFVFTATDKNVPIYHTNVILNIGVGYAVLCAEAIPDIKERKNLERILAFTGHEVILITLAQMRCFAGNMLQVEDKTSKKYTLLSASAIRSLKFAQIDVIIKNSELVSFDIPTIENVGGGSVRCMIAEVFSQLKKN